MKRQKHFLLKTLWLMGLVIAQMIFPMATTHACTTTPSPSPTQTYTPTATATDVPPGVTPAPSLTPTASATVPSMEQILAMRSDVVFRGELVRIEKQGEWEEAALVLVHHYYKGGGGSFARISGLSTFRLCNGFPSEPGIESVFYARRATDGMLYPIAAIGYEPQGIVGHAPRGLQIGFGIAETTTLGLVTFGSAMALIWMVRPRR